MVRSLGVVPILVIVFFASAARADLQPLKVSENGHYLETADGKPFFWLGDTAWGLFGHTSTDDAKMYLQDRADKGFTVIQAVALLWDATSRMLPPEKHPLINDDPTKPNEDYFKFADAAIDQAQADGMYTAIVPLWFKTFVTPNRMLLNPETAEGFGKFLGTRWKDKPVIWILGGDQPGGASRDPNHPVDQNLENICRALAKGLREGDAGKHLITYHPTGSIDGQSSSWWFENEPWLDFNGLQTGHFIDNHNYKLIAHDYSLSPPKPVIDLESGYENITDHLRSSMQPGVKRISAHDVRRYAYLAVFAGAAGYTYGNAEVYGFVATTRPVGRGYGSGLTWKQSLALPAAGQMQFLKNLMESRPMARRTPDQTLITSEPGDTTQRIEAIRGDDNSYQMYYTAGGKDFTCKIQNCSGTTVNLWKFNPRDGTAEKIQSMPKPGNEFSVKPDSEDDWVYVVDDASKNYPPPGQVK